VTPSGERLAEERRPHHVVGGEAPVSIDDMDQTVSETSVGAGSGLGRRRDTPGRSWRTVVAVVGVALAAGTTCATAGSLPIVASTQAATPSARDGQPSPGGAAAIDSADSFRPPTTPSSSRVQLRGQKWSAPQLQRSEAGIAWSPRPRVTLELNYERSALGPTMRHDHDDGIFTRLKLGF